VGMWLWLYLDLASPLNASFSGCSSPKIENPWIPFNRTLGGSQNRLGRCDKYKNFLSEPGIDHLFFPVSSLVIPTASEYSINLHIDKPQQLAQRDKTFPSCI